VIGMAQYGGGGTGAGSNSGGTTAAGPANVYNFNNTYHIGFDRPEAWGLKYFASTTLLSGLQPPEPAEGYRVGSVTIGFELGWLPALDAGQRRIGFNGTAPEDLNKAPIFARPVVRVGLPGKFSVVAAAPAPLQVFGLRPHLFAFGLERPILERKMWTVSWRGYGQLGSVKGAFTCPHSVLAFAPGSVGNPTQCLGESADVASLRYAGSEVQFAYRIPSMPKLTPHVAAGGNFMDGVFQVHAPVVGGLDQTRLWTRGGTFSGTAGLTYLLTKQAAFTVDVFYTPLWVQRTPGAPRTNDGLFNVRALLSYRIR
ncbi:MAG TPA: hypothetical protein VF767_09565, partial [Bryobacteraceae bacterium]